ncbi:MAG: type III-B CRISPR module RAMP protein Cmr4 [Limisphaerales bacterium]
MNDSRIIYLFTRTPLHVGAGTSVGAIDQPVRRERHTGFPIIPASSLKGSFADQWDANLTQGESKSLRVTTRRNEKDEEVVDEALASAWLFGSNNDKAPFTGAIQFGEARLLAFPIRSAIGSFGWITSPLLLRRAARDGVIPPDLIKDLKEPSDEKATFHTGKDSKLALDSKVVLEEYTFEASGWLGLDKLGSHLSSLLADEAVWSEIPSRLVILSDGMMSFFAQNACEVAQHVRISDETGTAEGGALFNQENVPSETLFYSVLRFFAGRGKKFKDKKPEDAVAEFAKKLAGQVLQFGGDASTGLGFCTVKLS